MLPELLAGQRPLPEKIAVLNFGGIGDEILFSPVLAALREQLPGARLTLVLEKRSQGIAPLLPGLDLAAGDRVMAVDLSSMSRGALFFTLAGMLSKGRYDAVLSSGSSPFIAPMLFLSAVPYRVGYRSGAFSSACLSQAAPLETRQYAPDMYFSLARTFLSGLSLPVPAWAERSPVLPRLAAPADEDTAWAAAFWQASAPDGKRRVLLHPGVSLMSVEKRILKAWPAGQWAAFIQQLAAQPDTAVVLAGGPDDAETVAGIEAALGPAESWPAGFVNAYGQTRSLGQLAALIQQADLLVSVDSAPMHLAVGYQTPVVAIFGPTDEKKLLPETSTSRAVTVRDLDCRPCLWDVRKTSCEQPVCLDVSLDAVLAAVAAIK